jgi:hypothetical protein
MEIRNPQITARQAADIFAAENFGEPRKVGRWINSPASFQLVGGVKVYGVESLPNFTGWRIVVLAVQVQA